MPPVLIESLNRLSSSTQENTADVDEDDTEVDEEVLVAAKALEIGIERRPYSEMQLLSLSLSPSQQRAPRNWRMLVRVTEIEETCECVREKGGLSD